MSERDGFRNGVPMWVESLQPDPKAGVAFYEALFGWEFHGSGPIEGDPSREYFLGRLRGRDVAGVAPTPPGFDFPRASWVTQIQADDAERTARAAEAAGGRILAGPMDFDPIGKLMVVADPQGAPIALWQPGVRKGAQLVNEPSAWAMSQLSTPDLGGAAQFYGEVFGWTTEAMAEGPGSPTLFRLPGYEGGEPEQPVSREVIAVMVANEGAASWTPDFWVDDVDLAAEKAISLGGAATVSPFDTPMGRMAVIADPQGGLFSITTIAQVAAAREAAEAAS
jgi:predicted enzyme related to lactoylglutathione lyase